MCTLREPSSRWPEPPACFPGCSIPVWHYHHPSQVKCIPLPWHSTATLTSPCLLSDCGFPFHSPQNNSTPCSALTGCYNLPHLYVTFSLTFLTQTPLKFSTQTTKRRDFPQCFFIFWPEQPAAPKIRESLLPALSTQTVRHREEDGRHKTQSGADVSRWTHSLPGEHFCSAYELLPCGHLDLTTSEALAWVPLQETDLMDGPFMQEKFIQWNWLYPLRDVRPMGKHGALYERSRRHISLCTDLRADIPRSSSFPQKPATTAV